MFALPLGEATVLVMEPEETGWEPPLDGSAQRGPVAPAIRIAAAVPVARIVKPLKDAARHVAERNALPPPGRA